MPIFQLMQVHTSFSFIVEILKELGEGDRLVTDNEALVLLLPCLGMLLQFCNACLYALC